MRASGGKLSLQIEEKLLQRPLGRSRPGKTDKGQCGWKGVSEGKLI